MLAYVPDLIFDLRHGTDTVPWVALRHLEIDSDNLHRGVGYQPTQVYPLRKLLKTLAIPQGKIFMDLGCGKGRVLMVAAEFGFRELRGVEFSSALCSTAKRNWAQYTARTGSTVPCRIIQSDIVDYEFHDEDVFYLFNPFDAEVLSRVLGKIVASLAGRERPIWIIYRNPLHRAVLEKSPALVLLRDFAIAGSDFAVYVTRSA